MKTAQILRCWLVVSAFLLLNLYLCTVSVLAAQLPDPLFSIPGGVYTNDSLSVQITWSGGAGAIRYTADGTVPTRSSLLYTNPITIASNSLIKAKAFSISGESAVTSDSYILLDSSARNFSSKVPIIIINTLGRPLDEVLQTLPRRKGSLTVLPVTNGLASISGPADYHSTAEFERFGQAAAGMPQIPMRIEVQDEIFNDRHVPLLGMPAESDWKLKNTYNVKCGLNDFLAYELFEQMGHYQLRRKMVEVFFDRGGGKLRFPDDYYGLMTFSETIEEGDNRVNIPQLGPADTNEPAITGGYIFKKDKDTQGDLNFFVAGGSGFQGLSLKLHEPKPADVRGSPSGSNQLAYLKGYLEDFSRALYNSSWLTQTGTNHYSHYIDVDSFVDYHWIVEFPKNIDGYRIDFFMHKDRLGKVKVGPIYDWDLAFGNADYLQGGMTNNWYYPQLGEPEHPILRRLITGLPTGDTNQGDPDFVQKIADRWSVLRTTILGTNLLQRIEELATVQEEASLRHFLRWGRLGTQTWPEPQGVRDGRDVDYVTPLVYRDGTTNSLIGQMEKFMMGRFLWIDEQFARAPQIIRRGNTVEIQAEPGSTIYYTVDGRDPRVPGGQVASGVVVSSSNVVLTLDSNAIVVARSRKEETWKNTWSGPSTSSFTRNALRITELMYHGKAPPDDGEVDQDFDFIEVKNISTERINLAGVRLIGGIQFNFPSVYLEAGASAVITGNSNVMRSFYPNAMVLGDYSGNLNNAGEEINLLDELGQSIQSFNYSDSWYPTTDGHGFSLVAVDETQGGSILNLARSWSRGSRIGGTPGFSETAPDYRTVVINELSPNQNGSLTVELLNLSSNEVSMLGWFLTDDPMVPAKFYIPATNLPSQGFLLVSINSGTASTGGELWLNAPEGALANSSYAMFGPISNGESMGHYSINHTNEHFLHLASPTPGTANSGPKLSNVMITEIHYRPFETGFMPGISLQNYRDEYVEIRNTTTEPVDLSGYRLDGNVKFQFPQGSILSPGSYALVTGIPVENTNSIGILRQTLAVPPSTQIFGSWEGNLPNRLGRVKLLGDAGTLLEEVAYSNNAPWPQVPASGFSIQKPTEVSFGNDPLNWLVSAPTPGTAFQAAQPPVLTFEPTSLAAIEGQAIAFTASAGGNGVRYQWRLNDSNIRFATNSTYRIPFVTNGLAGNYSVMVYNNGGYVISSNAYLSVRKQITISEQPTNRTETLGSTNVMLSVKADGPGILGYQWTLNGVAVPNATNRTYLIPLLNEQSTGSYRVEISATWNQNGWSGIDYQTSGPARVNLLHPPNIILHPLGQEAVEGGSATFLVMASGTDPMYFRWRTNNFSILPSRSGRTMGTSSYSFLILTNLRPGLITNVSVVVTNAASFGVQSLNAFLRVLSDFDRDGLPDQWEAGRQGFATNNVSDSLRDDDGDGINNAGEYIAGTDYSNSNSFLKAELQTNGEAIISFGTVAGHSYTVQFKESVAPGPWQKLVDVVAPAGGGVVSVRDTSARNLRFYRIVTPIQP